MLVGVLRTIAANDNPLVVPAFFLKVLAHEGFRPEVDQCVSCGVDDPLVAIDLLAGGMLCQALPSGPGRVARGAAPAAGGARRRAGRRCWPSEPSPAVAEVAAIATEAVEFHLERRLRTPGMLDRPALR